MKGLISFIIESCFFFSLSLFQPYSIYTDPNVIGYNPNGLLSTTTTTMNQTEMSTTQNNSPSLNKMVVTSSSNESWATRNMTRVCFSF